ncbi:MAG: DUF4093 domain-containing protein [Clostridia bacterium]|nr:DUF4093 domain-containing protein [Loktanella sp.]MBQ1950354.1 DUF4093 domain-containing protein [Clostridia bacterium]
MKRVVREAIVVEGKYDAIRVKSVVDALVVETGGFRLFRDKARVQMLRRLAATRGLIILTDSDSAGMVIRNHLLGVIPAQQVKIAYIPPVPGKERRKAAPSKEGLLGVEGMDNETVLSVLVRAGAQFADADSPVVHTMQLTKADLMAVGLSGGRHSAARRQAMLRMLELPSTLSTNRLLEFLNATVTPTEWERLLQRVDAASPV